jgi:serine phosphatase RsbU (regulator of sigma subunit)
MTETVLPDDSVAHALRDANEIARLLRSQQFLLRAARVLSDAGDYIEALDRLATVAVPLLGDLCVIDVLDGGELVRMVAVHADPEQQPLLDEMRLRYAPSVDSDHPSAVVIRTGESQWSADVDPEFPRSMSLDDRHREIVTTLDFGSFITVPLVARETIFGSLTLIVSRASGRHYDESDLALAEELAAHAAGVIERARRHDQDREAAHALQRSLLPAALPDVDGYEIAVRYLPGTDGAEVGGDWYDVFPLPDGQLGLAIGDVAGHDIGAAATMGQLRNALRAYAVRDIAPGITLHELRRLCEVTDAERIATVTYATVEPATGAVSIATAGHFGPLVRHADGSVEAVAVDPAPPLGVASTPPDEASFTLAPGDAMVLVTDGLVERRDESIDVGLARVEASLAVHTRPSAEELCDAVLEAAIDPGGHGDDVALLIVARS